MFGSKKFPIPSVLPTRCLDCGKKLRWEAITIWDPVIRLEKPDHYKAVCKEGHVHYRDGRGQAVEIPTPNLPPDRSEFAQSPQGPQPYSGYLVFVEQERAKAEALKATQAAKAAAAAAGPAEVPATASADAPQPPPAASTPLEAAAAPAAEATPTAE